MNNRTYIFNITFHCDAVSAPDVLYYLKEVLLPTWKDYTHWHGGRLLALQQAGGAPVTGDSSYALQFTADALEPLQRFVPADDPCVQRIERAYGNRVLYTDTILELVKE